VKKWNQSVFALFCTVLFLSAVMAAQNSTPANKENSSNAAGQHQVLIDPGVIYNAKSPTGWVGKTVTLKNVTVEDTNNSGNFWVGSDSHHRLLVVKPTSNLDLNALRTHKGDIVTVTGIVKPAGQYLAQKTGAEKNSMNDARNSSGVFLLASNVDIESATQR